MFCWSSSLAVIFVLAIRKNRTSYDFGDTSTIDKRKLFMFNLFLNILVSYVPIRLETITKRQTSGFGGGGFGMVNCGRVHKLNWGAMDELIKRG